MNSRPSARSLIILTLAWCGGCGAGDADVPRGSGVPMFQGLPGGTTMAAGPTAPGPVPAASMSPTQSTSPTPGMSPASEGTPVNGIQPPVGAAGAGGSAIPNSTGTGGTQVNAAPAPQPQTPAEPAASAPAGGGASAGCGLASGVPNSPQVASTILSFPRERYDGSTPLPLVFAFHGAGRTNADMRDVDSRTSGGELERNYVVAYVKSAGNGWDIGADFPRFEAILEQIASEYCIDTEHVFAFGHSSGAQFIAQMLGDARTRETRFAGVVPVASSRFFNPAWSPVPTLVIHGVNDTQRPGDESGAADVVQYTSSNQCSGATRTLEVASCASLAGGVSVDAGCLEFTGCGAPTIFCNHDDPNYLQNGQPTNHGWPCFANALIFEFFESLL